MANMLQLIFKNLITKQSTRLYPIAPERESFERSRGRIVMDPNTCILCGICARKCPADAITVQRGTGKWELDAYRCIICGECATACPKKSITLTNERRHSTEGKLFEGHHVEPPKPVQRPAGPRPTIVPTPVKAVAEPVATPVVKPVVEHMSEPTVEPASEPLVTPIVSPLVSPLVMPLISPLFTPLVTPIVTPEATPLTSPVTGNDDDITLAPSPDTITMPGHVTTPEGNNK